MSSEGFKNVPGVPEGWELLAVGLVTMGEWFVNRNGEPEQWNQDFRTTCMYAIIRKIETPKKYRPFKGGAEYMASGRQGVAVDWNFTEAHGFYAVVSANDSFVWVAFGTAVEQFDWSRALEKLHFHHADGSASPFGVEVTE
jgi:hypothetical protein